MKNENLTMLPDNRCLDQVSETNFKTENGNFDMKLRMIGCGLISMWGISSFSVSGAEAQSEASNRQTISGEEGANQFSKYEAYNAFARILEAENSRVASSSSAINNLLGTTDLDYSEVIQISREFLARVQTREKEEIENLCASAYGKNNLTVSQVVELFEAIDSRVEQDAVDFFEANARGALGTQGFNQLEISIEDNIVTRVNKMGRDLSTDNAMGAEPGDLFLKLFCE